MRIVRVADLPGFHNPFKCDMRRTLTAEGRQLEAYLNILSEPVRPIEAPQPSAPALPEPVPVGPSDRQIRAVNGLISTMVNLSADLNPGSMLQRDLAECAGRLQVALRTAVSE